MVENLVWQEKTTPKELVDLLTILGQEYPVRKGRKGIPLSFRKKKSEDAVYSLSSGKDGCLIEYSTLPAAARAIGSVLAGKKKESASTPLRTFGIMLDCSRNGVMTVEHLKLWLRRMALFGCGMIMLYCEDTYELPGEPFFGCQRGRYTLDELREIDDFAASLGIEVVGCIQTLGHMEQLLKWASAYRDISDTGDILLCDCDKTYDLIAKMAAFWSKALRSRRIHVGMDEAHSLGRGRYTDLRHGANVDVFDLFNRHFAKVIDIFGKEGLTPMIWSDMYFRLSNPEKDYYSLKSDVPEKVAKKIPKKAGLVYWDYYHEDQGFYEEFIERHRKLGHEPVVASGIWTWGKCWYDHLQTQRTVRPCLAACRKKKIRDLVFTMWGDNGDTCCMDSSLGGLSIAADLAFGAKEADPARFKAILGSDMNSLIAVSKLDLKFKDDAGKDLSANAVQLLWDDPLLQLLSNFKHAKMKSFASKYAKNCAGIAAKAKKAEQGSCGDYAFAADAANYLGAKVLLMEKLRKAYLKKDPSTLKMIAEKEIPSILRKLVPLAHSYRREWMSTFKPFGFEVIEIRLAGQKVRWEETKIRIEEFLSGKISSIAELEVEDFPKEFDLHPWYARIATACNAI